MYGALDISTSGMIAQRTRLTTIAANIANSNTLVNAQGEYAPYRRRIVTFTPGDPGARGGEGQSMGVHVSGIDLDRSPFVPKHDPDSPYADERGYVMTPNINPVVEQINAMETARAYEANVVAAETTKTMMAQALRLLA